MSLLKNRYLLLALALSSANFLTAQTDKTAAKFDLWDGVALCTAGYSAYKMWNQYQDSTAPSSSINKFATALTSFTEGILASHLLQGKYSSPRSEIIITTGVPLVGMQVTIDFLARPLAFNGFMTGAMLGHLVHKTISVATGEQEEGISDSELDQEPKKFTFKDLAGTIPEDVREVTSFITDSEKFRRMGAKMPKGILLVGPPGTGKTSIARAIAGEADASFFAATGTQFVECLVGLGASRVRKLFNDARESVKSGPYKKAIIFIDEIDAVGFKRSSFVVGGATENRTTLNELLNQLDGFAQDDSVFVIAATNRVQDLDAALTRSGRFDRIVTIPLPDKESRKAILEHYSTKITHSTAINFELLAEKTEGLACADLENLVNEAAIYAVRDNAPETTHEHFERVLANKEKYHSADEKS